MQKCCYLLGAFYCLIISSLIHHILKFKVMISIFTLMKVSEEEFGHWNLSIFLELNLGKYLWLWNFEFQNFQKFKNNKNVFSLQITNKKSITTSVGIHGQIQIFRCHFYFKIKKYFFFLILLWNMVKRLLNYVWSNFSSLFLSTLARLCLSFFASFINVLKYTNFFNLQDYVEYIVIIIKNLLNKYK